MIGPKPDRITRIQERLAYKQVEYRDEGACVKCRTRVGVQRDHRKNRSQGGLTSPENLQLLCGPCHLWKTEHPAEAVIGGLAVPGWGDPAVWPGRRWIDVGYSVLRRVWVVYDRNGSWVRISDEAAERRMQGADS